MTMRMKAAGKAALLHFFVSVLIAALAAALVLGVWFQGPYRDLAGGLHLLAVLIFVDVVCGPLLTLVIFNPAKPRRELAFDLTLVTAIQMAALLYGLYSISLARPVVLVYEVDRFVAVVKAQIDPADLPKAAPEYRTFPWLSGPRLVGIRPPKDGQEMLESVELSMKGKEPSVRPDWWQPYAQSVSEVKQRMQPIARLRENLAIEAQIELDTAINKTGLPAQNIFFLPLTNQKILDGWIVLLDGEAQIRGYAPFGGFLNN